MQSIDEAEASIRQGISVSRQRIAIAKHFVLQYEFSPETDNTDTDDVVRSFLEHVGAESVDRAPRTVQQETGRWSPELDTIADTLSWRLAALQAVSELTFSGSLMMTGDLQPWHPVVQYSSRGHGSSWRFIEFGVTYPCRILPPPSRRHGREEEVLSNTDLFLHAINVPNMPDSVREALGESVLCFRHGLYTASVVMLGKASEEAWIDVGVALYEALPGDQTKKIEDLTDPQTSIYRVLRTVVKLYEHSALDGIRRGSEVRNLNDALMWSDTVRDSRNVVHPGSTSSTPNTYEKVAALLLGVVPRMRELYRVRDAAQRHKR